jgi:hypothetical protein
MNHGNCDSYLAAEHKKRQFILKGDNLVICDPGLNQKNTTAETYIS